MVIRAHASWKQDSLKVCKGAHILSYRYMYMPKKFSYFRKFFLLSWENKCPASNGLSWLLKMKIDRRILRRKYFVTLLWNVVALCHHILMWFFEQTHHLTDFTRTCGSNLVFNIRNRVQIQFQLPLGKKKVGNKNHRNSFFSF